MPRSELIAPELPFLRRFARAITGSQEAGDGIVVALLEAMVADPKLYPSHLPAKIALFASFIKILECEHVAVPVGARVERLKPGLAAAEKHVNNLSMEPRRAFLLVAVEGFTAEEAALVLDTTPERVHALIDQAGSEIANQVATSILIIEDEPLIALDLADLVESMGHTVCEISATHTQAVTAFAKHKPGLVLSDVQLADGSSGLDAVRDILQSIEVPVIFITAFPERLLTGRPPEPAFLINKPFQPETVKAVISQALFFDHRARASTP